MFRPNARIASSIGTGQLSMGSAPIGRTIRGHVDSRVSDHTWRESHVPENEQDHYCGRASGSYFESLSVLLLSRLSVAWIRLN